MNPQCEAGELQEIERRRLACASERACASRARERLSGVESGWLKLW